MLTGHEILGDGGYRGITTITTPRRDKTGRIISPLQFDFGRDFSEGLAPVRIGKLWAFIDLSG
jgi:hypothetical protein